MQPPKFKPPMASPRNVQFSPGATRFNFMNATRQHLAKIKLRKLDITRYSPTTPGIIVNAANAELKKGGGVDNAIHHACQPDMQKLHDELKKIINNKGRNLLPGEVEVTPAYGRLEKNNIQCKFYSFRFYTIYFLAIVHAVGPIVRTARPLPIDVDAHTECYVKSLNALLSKKIRNIVSFYGFII